MAFNRFVSNAILLVTAPLLFSAATLYGDGSCTREGDRIYLSLKKSDLAPLLTFAGVAAGGVAIWQFWEMWKEEKGSERTSDMATIAPSPVTAPSPTNSLIRPPSLDFIREVFLNPDGTHKAYHAAANGITGDGKSTVIETIINALDGDKPSLKYLVNPKHVVSAPEWSYEPICTKIDEALDALQQLNELMQARISDPHFDKSAAPTLYFIIDEIDWICSVYGKKAVNLLRNLFKVGRSVQCYVFLAGQSAQLGTGFTSDDYRQMVRFVLGSEAVAFLNNPQFKWDANNYLETAQHWQREGKRFALIIPTKGEPFLQLIPHINRTIPDPLIPAPTAPNEPEGEDGLDLTKLYEQSRKQGWLTASKAKSFCWNLRGFSTTQIRKIFEELAANGNGYLRGENEGLEWRIDRVVD